MVTIGLLAALGTLAAAATASPQKATPLTVGSLLEFEVEPLTTPGEPPPGAQGQAGHETYTVTAPD